ncbi:MAG: alpha/beta hydrolase [Chloroflexi bacterium]|jgi:acetyl esterase|nr:alpha/beta hydrolase [Chloroflexota bacterium]MBT3864256.1 alpha/beta hydrolase [Chloroflexota bacterium]MBT4141651.1 alpha/beta hydrolase [Chloroflexota bacterium]MBT4341170.1 alpha/beta hydrolase [Chloroflexota bacterium]MBT5477317.1 alpha/beta hydrolase [Chloroflexota bacterium]
MPLHPQVQALMDRRTALGFPDNRDITPTKARANATAGRIAIPSVQEPVGEITERTIPGAADEIPIRIYRPTTEGPHPLIMLFHGGGWVIGDLDSEDSTSRGLVNRVNAVLISVDYRMAPEDRFPAAPEDCYAATVWAVKHADELGVDASNLAVAGTSAGGNLSAAVALMARDRGGPTIKHQVLFCPVIDRSFNRPSCIANAEGFGLTTEGMVWFWDQYIGSEEDGHHPYASVIRAEDLSGLADATVIAAEYDPLLDEASDYAAALKAAGNDVTYTEYRGMTHGFNGSFGLIDDAVKACDEASAGILRSFAK